MRYDDLAVLKAAFSALTNARFRGTNADQSPRWIAGEKVIKCQDGRRIICPHPRALCTKRFSQTCGVTHRRGHHFFGYNRWIKPNHRCWSPRLIVRRGVGRRFQRRRPTPGGESEESPPEQRRFSLSPGKLSITRAMSFRATDKVCLMTKKTYRLTIIEEREEVPSKPPSFFRESGGLLVRIALAVATFFHWGHS
jgi:hypothetical protein